MSEAERNDQAADELATVERWLKRQGYPSEYQTARELRAAGLRAEQGLYYESRDATGAVKAREIDVLARSEQYAFPGVFVRLIAECKYGWPGWLILTATSSEALGPVWAPWPAAAAAGEAVTRWLQDTAEWGRSAAWTTFMKIPDRFGFGLAQVETKAKSKTAGGASDDSDTPAAPAKSAYEAIQQVTSAALQLVAEHEGELAFLFPLLVVDGPLFQLGFREDGEQLLEPVESQRILWRGSSASPVVVDVVRRRALKAYACEAAPAVDAVQGILTSAARVAQARASDGQGVDGPGVRNPSGNPKI